MVSVQLGQVSDKRGHGRCGVGVGHADGPSRGERGAPATTAQVPGQLGLHQRRQVMERTLDLLPLLALAAQMRFSCSPDSVHPFMPLLATSSGQRQFPSPGDSEDDSGPDSEAVAAPRERREDNTLRVWWAGPVGPAHEGTGDQSGD